MPKILKLIIGIVGVLVLGWLVYFVISRTTAPKTANQESKLPEQTIEEKTGEPVATTANRLKILSENPVFDYWVASSTQEIFYVSETGKIAKANSDSQDTFLSEQPIENLNFILPSPDSQKIIAAFGNPNQPQFSIFDLMNNSWSPLPLEIKSMAWSPEGKRVAAVISQNNQANLAIIDIANYLSGDTKQKDKAIKTIIKNISLKDLKIDWLRPDEIIFTDKPSSLVAGSAWRLNLSKLNFDEIISPGAGLIIKWLKDDLGLKFQNQKSSLINWAGQTINDFSFMVLPDKCVLKSDFLYCFLFTPASPKTNWPDDYLQKSVYTEDDLYKFNLNNLTAPELVFESATEGKILDTSMTKLLGNQILFINRYDNRLYGLEVGG
ncbi:MAG: hypothetical protein AAB514_00095 [Patescibacteria group bacterium]